MIGRPLNLPSSFFKEPFKKMYHNAKNPREKIRYLALSLIQKGEHLTTVAQQLDICRKTVGNWLQRYLNEGLQGLHERPASGGRPGLLSQQQLQALPQIVQQLQQQRSAGRVMARDIQQYFLQQGVKCSESVIYTWFSKAGLSWVSSRSRHPQSDPDTQEEFKKKISPSRPASRRQQSTGANPTRVVSR